jgi:hypothetical protein
MRQLCLRDSTLKVMAARLRVWRFPADTLSLTGGNALRPLSEWPTIQTLVANFPESDFMTASGPTPLLSVV